MLSSEQARRAAAECGADLLGVASADRFRSLPADANPLSIKPDTRTVFVLAFRLPRGGLRGVETGTAWNTSSLPWHFIIEATYLFSRWLEDHGYEGSPVFGHARDMRNQGVPVAPDKPAPDVILDFDYAAHAAGLGGVGMGKLFLTPEFGPRQVFTAVLTEAEFQPDAIASRPVCDECGACVAACPAQALSATAWTEAALCEGTARWRTLRIESCRICETGKTTPPFSLATDPIRIGAACGRACVAHLEDSGQLSRKFANPFRGPVGG